jgi:hypothetical protein
VWNARTNAPCTDGMLYTHREVVESILLLLRIVCTKTENNKASFMRHGGCKLLIAAFNQWADVSVHAHNYTLLCSFVHRVAVIACSSVAINNCLRTMYTPRVYTYTCIYDS